MSTDMGAGARHRPRTRVGLSRQLLVWRAFLRAHAAIMRNLEHDLVDAHDLPLAWYDVLVQLAEAPDRRLRMTDLADRVLLSRSGLTRMVDRLTATGLVRRQADPNDARGTFTVLTDRGFDQLRDAAPTHLRGIQAYMTRLSAEEMQILGSLLVKLLDGAASDGEPGQSGGGPVGSGSVSGGSVSGGQTGGGQVAAAGWPLADRRLTSG